MKTLLLRRVFVFVMCASLILSANDLAVGQSVDLRSVADLVKAHVENIKKLQPIHYRVVNYRGDKEFKTFSYEIWSAGLREAFVTKNYIDTSAGKETRLDEKNCRVSTIIIDDKAAKYIEGFDLNAIPSQRIELGRNADEFSKISGLLETRQPVKSYFISLFDIYPLIPLERLAKTSSFAVEASDVSGLVCIVVKSSSFKFLVGDRIYLDPARNFMIAKYVAPANGTTAVIDWWEIEGGLWFPKKYTYSDNDGKITAIDEVEFAKKMTQADLGMLDVSFPEGSRVDEPEKRLFHVWGKNSPEATFDKIEEFVKFTHAKAREYQIENAVHTGGFSRYQIGALVIVNLVGLGLLFWLFRIRARLRRA